MERLKQFEVRESSRESDLALTSYKPPTVATAQYFGSSKTIDSFLGHNNNRFLRHYCLIDEQCMQIKRTSY